MQFCGSQSFYIVGPPSPSPEFFSSSLTETLYPLNASSPFSHSRSPWPPPFSFLPLWLWLLREPHRSGIPPRLSFCDWLLSPSIRSSRFVCVVVCIKISFLFKANYSPLCAYITFCLFVYVPMDNSLFWILWVMQLWAWCTNTYSNPSFQLSWYIPRNGIAGSFWENCTTF